MSELNERLHEEFERLKQWRDELRVQLDLGKKDAQDAWHEVDHKWNELEGRLRRLAHEAGDAASDIGEASSLLMEEVREGLGRLRKLL